MDRETPQQPEEFVSMEPPADPEGYVGPDGKAAPHEQPWEVREEYDEGLTGPDADAATG